MNCKRCGNEDPRLLLKHHKLPRSWGGGDEEDNMETLCYNCHRLTHLELSQKKGENVVNTLEDGRIEIMFWKPPRFKDSGQALMLLLGYHKGSEIIKRNGFVMGVRCFPKVWMKVMDDFGATKKAKKEFVAAMGYERD